MYTSDNIVYIQTNKIRNGEFALLPHDEEMVNWLSKQCGFRVFNFYFDTVQTSVGYKLQHVTLIVQKNSEAQSPRNKALSPSIIVKFHEYFDKYKPSQNDETKRKIFSRENLLYPDINISFASMEDIDLVEVYRQTDAEIDRVIKQTPDIWTISNNGQYKTIFYYTDEQWKQNESNGVNQNIRNQVLEILKKNDPYNCFGEHSLRLIFDSKECFDRDYSSNWYYYYK